MKKRLYLCAALTALAVSLGSSPVSAAPPRNPGKVVLPDAAGTFGIFEFLERLFGWPGEGTVSPPRGGTESPGKGDTPRDPDDPPPCPPEALPDDPCARGHGPVG